MSRALFATRKIVNSPKNKKSDGIHFRKIPGVAGVLNCWLNDEEYCRHFRNVSKARQFFRKVDGSRV